jgi:NADPH:quinone reductase-like Zn-dependent oxidoreductase/SAM-dependent methyltransferase
MNPRRLASYCAAYAKSQQPEPVGYYRELDFMLYKFLDRAMTALADFTPEYTLSVPPYLKKYVAWARFQQENFVNEKTPLKKAEWAELIENEAYFEAACHRIASSNAQGYAYVRTGQNLLSILRGEQDALQFLYSQNMMSNFYQEFNSNRAGLDQWAVYLRILADKNPGMKILEIGAGTGGSTARVLQTLYPTGASQPLYRSYDYTDISPAFFDNAAQMYKRYPGLKFRTLNIEDDASINKFELGSYDLIVAGSVLHATRFIDHTMQNVRKLLKSRGKLMIYEPVRPDIIRSSFIGGLLEGWWSSADDDRTRSPLLTEAQWDVVLRNAGFSGIDVSLHDYENQHCWELSVLLTTAVPTLPCTQQGENNVCFVVDPGSSAKHAIFEKAKDEIALRLPKDYVIKICSLEHCVFQPGLTNTTLVFIAETEAPFLHCMDPETFRRLQYVVSRCANVLWVTAGGGGPSPRPEYTIVHGWTRSLRNEMPNTRIVTLALDMPSREIRDNQISYMIQVLTTVVMDTESDTYEPEFVEVDGILHIPRIYDDPQLQYRLFPAMQPPRSSMTAFEDAGPVRLAIEHNGLLDTLYWKEDLEYNPQQPLQSDEVVVQVQAVGINLEDCSIALGQMPGAKFGLEFAGIVIRAGQCTPFEPGNRVVGCAKESFKTFVHTKANLTCHIPESMTFSEAASVPTQFSTAWHVIHDIAHLKPRESILIHSAAAGTGQAVLQIAHSAGAEIYATVGSKGEKDMLMVEYGVAADHIFYNHDTLFAKGVMRVTKARGIDVIINNLSGDLLRASWECIASKGRFVDIGGEDIEANNKLPMGPFGRHATFTHFYSSPTPEQQHEKWKSNMETLLQLFADGHLHTQRPLQVLSIGDVEQAFRKMQSGSEAGKIVLQIEPQAQVRKIVKPKLHSCTLDPKATYLVVGGLGGLGRTIARWMVSRGARNLVLLGRSGATSSAAMQLLSELREQQHQDSIRIEAPPCDVADVTALQRVLQHIATTMPTIRGCVHAAMVLRDVMFANMTYDDWAVSLTCKVQGSLNLAGSLPADLDFFVLLSSASGLVGLPGQSNYAAGNTYLDGLARSRVAMGQKAVSIDLGAMVQDGFLAESPDFLEKVLYYGTLSAVSRSQFLALLDYYCDSALPLLSPTEAQVAVGIPTSLTDTGTDRMNGLLTRQPLFRRLLLNTKDEHALPDGATTDYKQLFASAKSLGEARAIVFDALVEKVQRACNLERDNVESYRNTPIQKLGVDSLLAVEVCNWIEKEFCAEVAVFELMGGETLSTVDELVARRSQITHHNWN